MKRILIMVLVGVMAFSVVALGGWKFGAKQSVDVVGGDFPLDAYVGYDFDYPYIDTGPVSIAGDFVLTRSYNWGDGVLSGLLGFDGKLTFSYIDDFDIAFWTSSDIDYAGLPETIDLLGWDFGVDVIGYVTDVLTLSTGINFNYIANLPGPGIIPGFNTKFFFGFDAEW